MRTSQYELVRAYLKFYNNPDTLIKVKIEPLQNLINRAYSGHVDTPILLNNNNNVREPLSNDISINIPKSKKTHNIQENKRLNSIE